MTTSAMAGQTSGMGQAHSAGDRAGRRFSYAAEILASIGGAGIPEHDLCGHSGSSCVQRPDASPFRERVGHRCVLRDACRRCCRWSSGADRRSWRSRQKMCSGFAGVTAGDDRGLSSAGERGEARRTRSLRGCLLQPYAEYLAAFDPARPRDRPVPFARYAERGRRLRCCVPRATAASVFCCVRCV